MADHPNPIVMEPAYLHCKNIVSIATIARMATEIIDFDTSLRRWTRRYLLLSCSTNGCFMRVIAENKHRNTSPGFAILNELINNAIVRRRIITRKQRIWLLASLMCSLISLQVIPLAYMEIIFASMSSLTLVWFFFRICGLNSLLQSYGTEISVSPKFVFSVFLL